MCILSGSFGDGHDAAARAIRDTLADHGIDAVILDVVDRYPLRLGHALKRLYLWQVSTIPVTWRWFLDWLAPTSGRGNRIAQRLALLAVGSASRGLRSLPRMYDAVISTHPFASQVLGLLAEQGHLGQTRSFTYLTDLSVHPLWISPAVAEHLALHEVAAAEAGWLGAASVAVVRPATRDLSTAAPTSARARADRRRQFDLPDVGTVVAVTGGAEGVGDLEATTRDLLTIPGVLPLVLCGRNVALRARLDALPGVTALGWVDDMAAIYATADIVLQNAGGSTSLEALAVGLPVLSYRCLPGHGETNAANLARAGLAPWVRSRDELAPAIAEARSATRPIAFAGAPSVVSVIVAALQPAGADRLAS